MNQTLTTRLQLSSGKLVSHYCKKVGGLIPGHEVCLYRVRALLRQSFAVLINCTCVFALFLCLWVYATFSHAISFISTFLFCLLSNAVTSVVSVFGLSVWAIPSPLCVPYRSSRSAICQVTSNLCQPGGTHR